MNWDHFVIGIIGLFVGGTLGALAMALCAMAGRSGEGETE